MCQIVAMRVCVGRVQRQTRRCLIASNGEPVPFSTLAEWCYTRGRRPWRWPIYRALKRWAEPAGRRGMWVPNPELMAKIRGDF